MENETKNTYHFIRVEVWIVCTSIFVSRITEICVVGYNSFFGGGMSCKYYGSNEYEIPPQIDTAVISKVGVT